MKTKNKIVAWMALSAIALLYSCSQDFLDRPPLDAMVDANYYQTNDQVLAGTAALYSAAWKDYCDQPNWKLGDVRAGLVYSPWATSTDIRDFTTFNVTGLSAANVNAYRAFYQVVGQANTVIHNINLYAGAEVSESIKKYAIAEARFMRATAYTYLVMNYGAVPIIEDNTQYLIKSALKRNTVGSVWDFIKRDYTYASHNMPATALQEGRLTRWSAEGMLARTYLTLAGVSGSLNKNYLDSAKFYANRVITQSGKQLLPDYTQLFLYPYDNNNESLFELQWVYTSNTDLSYKYANTMVSQITPSNSIAANSDGWGGGVGATNWMLSLYEGLYVGYNGSATTAPGFTVDKRLRNTFMLPGATYPELATSDNSFLSAGDHAVLFKPNNGNATPGDGMNFAWIKKYVIGNIPGQTNKQNYPNNTYMLRLAEMYLIYAEAEILKSGGTTSDAQALAYFNAVHKRAGLPEFTGPLTWKGLFEERVKEFAMEGMAWYDLARVHYHNPQAAYNIINSQQRGQFLIVPENSSNNPKCSFYKTLWDTETDRIQASDANFMLPIPQVEMSQAPSLADEPVPYEFK